METIWLDKVRQSILESKPFVMPTETVYGLAAVSTDRRMVERVYGIKKRPMDNPLISHFHSFELILEYMDREKIPPYWFDLVKEFSPGPLTYLLPVKTKSPLIMSHMGFEHICCRIPDHPIALSILRHLDIPVDAPSANTSGYYSPTDFSMVKKDLGGHEDIGCIIDGGESVVGIESTIIDCTKQSSIRILRPGIIGFDELRQVLPTNVDIIMYSDKHKEPIPGNMHPHYKPHTPISLVDTNGDVENIVRICVGLNEPAKPLRNHIYLGVNPYNIASKLYKSLYDADQMKPDLIVLEVSKSYRELPDSGIKRAINNRLSKILA